MNLLKKAGVLFWSILCCTTICNAQYTAKREADVFPKNNIKLNVLALPLRTASLQYERGFNDDISAAVSIRLQPTGHIPLKSTFESAFKVTTIAGKDFAENAHTSSFAVTAEGRYYLGRRPLNGLYIAPFLRYSTYKIGWAYNFQNEDSSVTLVDITGKVSGITGGLLLGAQWHLKKNWLIDWWIAGPSYGQLNLSLTGEGGLENMKIEDRVRLEYTIRSITVGGSAFNAKVEQNSINVTGSVPFPGIRTGLCIGYSF